MLRFFVVIFFVCYSSIVFGQDDSLFVFPRGNSFSIMYRVQNGENIFTLSRRFHVPPAALADANGLTYQSAIANNTLVSVPLAAYNQLKDKPANMGDARPLYYRVRDEDNLYRIAKYADVPQHLLQQWNKISGNSVSMGQLLFVGWVLFDATGISTAPKVVVNPQTQSQPINNKLPNTSAAKLLSNPNMKQVVQKNKDGSTSIVLVPADTPKHLDSLYTMSPFGKLYLQQTDSGASIDSERGPAVFFEAKTATTKNMFYAFHNTVPRGTIIRVYSINSQKSILVKVIGAVPDTKQFYNCVIGISKDAIEALGAQQDKIWCELWYAKIKAKKPLH